LKWKQVSAVCLESEPRGYLVTKYATGGTWRYQAIRLGSPSVSLLVADTAGECKAACEEDAK
jgi:hypothetical protein